MQEPEVSKKPGRAGLWIAAAAGLGLCAVLLGGVALFVSYIIFSSPRIEGPRAIDQWVRSVAWSPDGSKLIAGSADKCFTIWDTVSGTQTGSFAGFPGKLRSVAWSPDGRTIATGSEGNINLWDGETAKPVNNLSNGDFLGYIAWSPDSTHLASSGASNRVLIWVPGNPSPVLTLGGQHKLPITGLVWSPDGTRIASASADGSVVVWDAGAGKALHKLTGHRGWVNALDWSPDGATIASGADDGVIFLWDPETGKSVRKLEGHTPSVSIYSAAWSPAGDRLATAGLDDQIILWDPRTGDPLARIPTGGQDILSLAWSPDGQRLASGTAQDTVLVWDLQSGKVIFSLPSACKAEGRTK